MKLIVGLGNKGEKYETTRHNAAWIVLDEIVKEMGLLWEKDNMREAVVAKGDEMTFAKPLMYMNESGRAVGKLLKWYGMMQTENLVVIHDDIALPVGTFKISHERGDGGHNGVASVTKAVGTKKYTRIRIGIAPRTFFGKIRQPANRRAFVLKNFTGGELKKTLHLAPEIKEAIKEITNNGPEAAMNQFN